MRTRPLAASDLTALHALYPEHGDPERTELLLRYFVRGWQEDGLSNWAVEDDDGGGLIGHGGVRRLTSPPTWNLGYRIAPSHRRRGHALAVARLALDAAAATDPSVPVTARLAETNDASRRTAEAAGLALVWRGKDLGNPDPTAIRLIYADRQIDEATLEPLVRSFMA